MAVLVLSGPENFGKRQKLRELTLPGFRLTFLFPVFLSLCLFAFFCFYIFVFLFSKEAEVEGADAARISAHFPFPCRSQKFKSRPTAEAGFGFYQAKQYGHKILQISFQEASQHNDILHLEMAESYANLPRKTLAGLYFVLKRY